MQLLDLPNELLLKVFEYGGTDTLIGGPSQACQRLREISDEPQLWHDCLSPHFRSRYIPPHQVLQIKDYRKWCLEQRVATRRTLEGLDILVSEMREASPEDIEAYVWQILKLRLSATEGLQMSKESPRSIAHYHWAHWLTEIMYRLEGVHMLLKLSTMDNWGNGIVERPIDQIIALYTLRNGRYASELFEAVHLSEYEPSALKIQKDGTTNVDSYEAASQLAQHVFRVFAKVTTRNDFLAVLGRGALFVELAAKIAPKAGWHTRLLKMPLGSFVCIQPAEGEAFFVDFQREGKLRSLEDVRDRLNRVGATGSVHSGVSLYDTLATSYVWHTVPTSTRHCVLDLIEHAANDVKVTYLTHAPRLYANLVRRIITRNVSEVENAPLSRAVSSASLASLVGTTPGGWLRRGKLVRILAGDHGSDAGDDLPRDRHNEPEGSRSERRATFAFGDNAVQTVAAENDQSGHNVPTGVVLEVTDGSVLVLNGAEVVRVIKQMLQPAKHVTMTTVAGLRVPDIGCDLRYLGQYFTHYNLQTERFE